MTTFVPILIPLFLEEDKMYNMTKNLKLKVEKI